MKYRREIDGLRAFAVLPVILFHAGFPAFSGGFVGVDVFFVISGYLITTIILSEMEEGKFSIINFYDRRARRIVPALFLVLLASTLLSLVWLPPSHMKDYSESLVAVSLFSSNILFWQETGYWGIENELKPLLHTWSLAVEEQYYILFPLFLILMWRFGKRWILVSFFSITLASLLLSQWASSRDPSANFFLLPTRGWELAIGAGIAFYFLYRKAFIDSLLSHKVVDEVMGWAGLSLIAYSVLTFDENTPFPGFFALIPTVGTALVILFASQQTTAGKLLGSRALVGVGLISYSAYLWHQPLFAFARHATPYEPSATTLSALAILSLVLAFFSWKYVEAPFRNRNAFSRRQIFTGTAVGSIAFIAFGLLGYFTNGFEGRFEKEFVNSINSAKQVIRVRDLCQNSEAGTKNRYCLLVEGEKDSAVLFGDSHASALAQSLTQAFSQSDMGLLLITKTGCPPVTGIYRADTPNHKACYQHNKQAYDYILNDKSITHVILAARWTLGMEGTRFDNLEGGKERGRKPHLDIVEGGRYLHHEKYDHRELITQRYVDSVEALLDAGKKVVLVYPIPEAGWNVPDFLTRYYQSNPYSSPDTSIASTSYDVFLKRNQRTIDALDKIAPNKNLVRVYPGEIFCDSALAGRCITHENGKIFYRDDDHLSYSGAQQIVQKIMTLFE
ncbi:O-acetyltransferase OatA [Halioglobus japonicus]|nr:O-acetyltransferase OatA [Halioglobus japonicus]